MSKTYKKVSKKYVPFFELSDVYFDGEIIGSLNSYSKLDLTITEQYTKFTCDDTGGNVRAKKINSIDIVGNMELMLNNETMIKYTNIFQENEEDNGININLSKTLGTTGKSGVLKITSKGSINSYVFNKCLIKGDIPINLNTGENSLVNLEFIIIPEKVNDEFVLMAKEGDNYFSFSSLPEAEEFGDSGFDKGIFKE